MVAKGAIAMARFRVRTLMIAAAFPALLLASIGPGRQWYRRWSYHRSQAAVFARLEGTERRNVARSRQSATDRGAIRSWLIDTQGFAGKSPQEVDRAIDRAAETHRQQADQSLAAANRWAEQRRDSETAAFWSWDPFAPDVP
jgi:hypothetical protein